MNVETGAEAAQFPEKEYINGIAVAVDSKMYEFGGKCRKWYTSYDLTSYYLITYRDGIFKHLRGPGIDSFNLCSLMIRNNNPIPTRSLAPIDF
jgi:hypothetical protein